MVEPSHLLDSSILIHLLEGFPQVLADKVQASEEGALIVSVITYAEVMLGAVRADRVEPATRLFDRFDIVPFDPNAAACYARLPCKRGSFDRLIAAHALSLDLPIVTANMRDFRDIPGLVVENWAE